MSSGRLETAERIPLYTFIKEHPLQVVVAGRELANKQFSRFSTLDFSYLTKDRLSNRESKYEPDKKYSLNDEQLPGTGLFEIEGQKIQELIDVCQTRGIADIDIVKLFPAMHISLYAHQLQFRESGEPYSIHVFDLAIEAVRDFGADWQTAALALLHDVKEDSHQYHRDVPSWYVKVIYMQLFSELGYRDKKEAEKDADFLIRGMDALHKVSDRDKSSQKEPHEETVNQMITGSQKLPANLETVKKLYTPFVSHPNNDRENARIILIKLLDRKNFLETSSSMPIEKQKEKALEALLVYVPMADAFHLYDLKNKVAKLAYDILDPSESAYIQGVMEVNQEYIKVLENAKIAQAIIEELATYKTSLGIREIRLCVPDFTTTYNLANLSVLQNPHKIFVEVMLEEDFEGTETEWYSYCSDVELAVANIFHDKRPYDFQGIAFDHEVKIYDPRRENTRQASILDYFPANQNESQSIADWEQGAAEVTEEVRDRLKQARKLNDFSMFLEATVAGHRKVTDRKRDRELFLPEEASLFDLLWIVYGEKTARGFEVKVKIGGEVKNYKREEWGMAISEGMELLGLIEWTFIEGKVYSDDLKYSRLPGVRESIVGLLQKRQEYDPDQKDSIIQTGYDLVNEAYEQLCQNSPEFTADEYGEHRLIPLRLENIREVFAAKYQYPDELAYYLGLGQVPRSVFREVLREMFLYRMNMIYFSLGYSRSDEDRKIWEVWEEFQIRPIEYVFHELVEGSDKFRDTRGITRECVMWIPEEEMGEISRRMERFVQLQEKFRSLGFEFYRNPGWRKWKTLFIPPSPKTVEVSEEPLEREI